MYMYCVYVWGRGKVGNDGSSTGGKVRVISREALARGDIARDPTFSRQIPCLHVRLREMMEWREAAGLRAILCAYN